MITLGLSEFNDRKSEGNNKIKQVKTQQIYDAVKAIPKNNKDLLLNQWENSLKNNLELSKIFTEKRFQGGFYYYYSTNRTCSVSYRYE